MLSEKQYKEIGQLMVVEMDRNRSFRRKIESLPLGRHIVAVIARDETFIPIAERSKQSLIKRLIAKFKAWNNQEV